ncbi:uncharacterized protein LOC122016342 [Zingiber officinale]|uniref:Uncharacterized protein n=1 Tax=Zingiber officinale TaxID=94328 RepID=A0A8J5KMI3_ZINOF|nr:uncharacterized protein LOC122016342 [Zingiber officinale]KAG6482613.1 hypothetical protein ZIOFF_059246 [Zingiber officinale]
MASLQATFALGAPQRRSHVRLSPANTIVLRPTSHLFRRRLCSSSSSVASCIPREGSSNGKAAAAAALQALAVAAACAVGASVCLSRAAVISNVSPLRKPDSIPTWTAPAPAPAPASAGEERRMGRAGKTPLLLDEIMFRRKGPGTECEDPCKKLIDHAFAILPSPWDDQFRLLEQISKGKITDLNRGKHEEYEIQIAMVQLYLAMHQFHDAKEVLQSLEGIESDARIDRLQAVVHVMLAMEKMLRKATTTKEEDKEIKDLLDSAKESWKKFEKNKDLQNEPDTNDDNS